MPPVERSSIFFFMLAFRAEKGGTPGDSVLEMELSGESAALPVDLLSITPFLHLRHIFMLDIFAERAYTTRIFKRSLENSGRLVRRILLFCGFAQKIAAANGVRRRSVSAAKRPLTARECF